MKVAMVRLWEETGGGFLVTSVTCFSDCMGGRNAKGLGSGYLAVQYLGVSPKTPKTDLECIGGRSSRSCMPCL